MPTGRSRPSRPSAPATPSASRCGSRSSSAIILAMPVILYQVWAFIAPGLTAAERKAIRPWVPLALLFFALGVGIAYVVLPYALSFLSQLQRRPPGRERRGRAVLRLRHDDVPGVRARHGVPDPARRAGPGRHPDLGRSSARLRRFVILGIAIFSAIATPGGDLVSPFVLGGTMYLLFEADDLRHPAERPVTDAAEVTVDGRPTRPGGRHPERPVRRRQDRRGEAVRGPRLHRRRQPAGRAAAATWPSSSPPTGAVRPGRHRPRRPRRATPPLALAAMRGALEGRGISPRIVFLEARDEVLIRRFSETRHRHPLATAAASPARSPTSDAVLEPVRAEADVVVDTSDLSLRQLRERLFAQVATTARPDQLAHPDHQLRLQVRRPARGRPRVRRPVHAEPVLHPRAAPRSPGLTEPVREYVLGQPITAALPGVPAGVPRLHRPGLRRRGQDPADDRHRLHRRLPPLDRHRRGARRLAARAGPRPGRDLPSRARPGPDEPAALADARDRRQALARSSSSPACSLLALAVAHVLRQIYPGPRAGRAARQRSIDLATLQFLPFAAARPDLRVDRASALVVARRRTGVVRAVTDPLRRAATPTSRSSRSSTRSGSSPAGRGSSRSAAGPACRPCCAGSRSTPAT